MFNPAQEMSSISFDKIIGGTLNAVVSAQNQSSLTTVHFIKSVGFENDENGNAIKPVYVDFKYPKEVSPYVPGKAEYYSVRVVNGGSGYKEAELNSATINGLPDGVKLRFTVDSNGSISSVDVVEGEFAEAKQFSVEVGGGSGAAIKSVKHERVAPKEAVYKDMVLQVPLLTIVPIPFIKIESSDLEFNVKINSISNTEESKSTSVNAGMDASLKYKGIVQAGLSISASVAHQQKKSQTEQVQKEYSLNVKIHAVQEDMPVGMSRILDILEESIVPKDGTNNKPVAPKEEK